MLPVTALALTLSWTDSERSRDSWSKTTTVTVAGDAVSYGETLGGSAKRRGKPVSATVPLTPELRASLVEIIDEHDLASDHTVTGETGGPYRSLSVRLQVEVGGETASTTVQAGPGGGPPPAQPGQSAPSRPPTVDDDPVVRGCAALLSAVRRATRPAKAGKPGEPPPPL